MIRLPQICLNFLDFPHRLGGKEILWGKRNFGDCKRIFEQAVVEALYRSPMRGNEVRFCLLNFHHQDKEIFGFQLNFPWKFRRKI